MARSTVRWIITLAMVNTKAGSRPRRLPINEAVENEFAARAQNDKRSGEERYGLRSGPLRRRRTQVLT